MNPSALFSGALRGALSAGSMVRLAQWTKERPGRSMRLDLAYKDGLASWSIELSELAGPVAQVTAETLETAIGAAVVKIGV